MIQGGFEMHERIKQLRKELDLTQQRFADRIGIKRNTIATYESGRNEPIDAVVSLICKEFNVNEDWLRYGTGSMFVETDTFSLDEFAKSHNATELELEILKSYFELDIKTRQAILSLFTNRIPAKKHLYDNVPKTSEELEKKYGSIEETENNVG